MLMSKQHLLLITGWGVGTSTLQPLAQALQQFGYVVTLLDIFDPKYVLQQQHIVDRALPADILIGWSLGGQLAICLAAQLYTQDAKVRPVITLASNPCFVASNGWQAAMPIQDFQQFKQQYSNDALQTLQRFYFNICRGDSQCKQQWRVLLKQLPELDLSQYDMGLMLLQDLNVIELLDMQGMYTHHIFAERDALVPVQVTNQLIKLSSGQLSFEVMPKVGHSFPAFHIQDTVQRIQDYLATA